MFGNSFEDDEAQDDDIDPNDCWEEEDDEEYFADDEGLEDSADDLDSCSSSSTSNAQDFRISFPFTDYSKNGGNRLQEGSDKPDITQLGINEILGCGIFTPEERAAEYRRRGKSPSGVIDGEYNDEYRGNDEYNDSYRDWDANA